MQREGSVSSIKMLSVLNKGFELILCAQNDKCVVPLSFHIVLVAVGCGKIFCAPDQIGKTKLAEAWYQDLLKFSKHF